MTAAIYDAMRRVYGGAVAREPQNYAGYSDHRPDITLSQEGSLTAYDVKVFDPIGSQPADTGERGAYLAFGNTIERCRDAVLGRRGRGARGDGAYCRRTGAGHVAGARRRAAQDGGVAAEPPRELRVRRGDVGDADVHALRLPAHLGGDPAGDGAADRRGDADVGGGRPARGALSRRRKAGTSRGDASAGSR